jgi:uncharacterized protein YdhG (YjbR/CyaY superfamily)
MVKPASVEAYLDALDPARREVVESIRATARAAAPAADEVIAYDMPALRLGGRFLVSYAAYRRHYSLFPWNPFVIAEVGEAALVPFMAGRGTIQFPAGKPVPLDLVRQVVAARVREFEAKGAASD